MSREADLRNALNKLIHRIDEVHHSDQWRFVWQVYHTHEGPYWGPAYDKELEEARHILEERQS